MPPRHRWALGVAASIPLAAIVFAFSIGPSPEKALVRFYDAPASATAPLAELQHAGRRIIPLVISEIARKDMPKRRQAIRFLGETKESAALPALELILHDEGEGDETRADALQAITGIDPIRGRELATLHRARAGVLGTSAKEISDL